MLGIDIFRQIKAGLVEVCYILSEQSGKQRCGFSPDGLGYEFREISQELSFQAINVLIWR